MKSILFVNGCIRGEESRTLLMARRFLDCLRGKYEITEVNGLCLPLDREALKKRDRLAAQGNWDDPVFDEARTFPAAVHAYIEQICVTGLTFGYREDGTAEGYGKAKRAIFFSTRGGIYSEGPNKKDDHAGKFLDSVFRMLGIQRTDVVTADGLDIIGNDVGLIMDQAVREAELLAGTF